MQIEINETDIALGEYARLSRTRITESCPLAQALNRIFPTSDCWSGRDFVNVADAFYPLSEEGKKFVKDFDGGIKVKPTTIEIEGL